MENFKVFYQLNPSLRRDFAKPLGELFTGNTSESIPKAIEWIKNTVPTLLNQSQSSPSLRIICVGDVISQGMLNTPQIRPYLKFCFIDGKTQRGNDQTLSNSKLFHKISFSNPQGGINSAIFSFLQPKFRDSEQYIIEVEGEEDLLVLPAVIESPENWLIFYGQPPITDLETSIPAGCVGIHVTTSLKESFSTILNKFDKILF